MSVLKRWTGTEWETIGMGASLDINGFSAVASINGKTGTVILGPGDIAYSSSATYSNNSIGKTVSDLVTNTTPIILTGESLFPQVTAALNSGRPVYAELDGVRHYLVYKYLQTTGGTMQAIFAAVTGSNISIMTYKSTGMTHTTTSVADSNYQATFGTTTLEEIKTAVANHKNVQCKNGNFIYTLISLTNSYAWFMCSYVDGDDKFKYNEISCTTSGWTQYLNGPLNSWRLDYNPNTSPYYDESTGDPIDPTDTVAGKLKELDNNVTNMWKTIYPIGSIYMSCNSTDPAQLFGGNWAPIEGKFLLAADSTYTGGSVGGSAEVALTTAQLPSITGSFHMRNFGSTGVLVTNAEGVFSSSHDSTLSIGNGAASQSSSGGNGSEKISIAFGANSAHNNMPPYLAVYMWRRLA